MTQILVVVPIDSTVAGSVENNHLLSAMCITLDYKSVAIGQNNHPDKLQFKVYQASKVSNKLEIWLFEGFRLLWMGAIFPHPVIGILNAIYLPSNTLYSQDGMQKQVIIESRERILWQINRFQEFLNYRNFILHVTDALDAPSLNDLFDNNLESSISAYSYTLDELDQFAPRLREDLDLEI